MTKALTKKIYWIPIGVLSSVFAGVGMTVLFFAFATQAHASTLLKPPPNNLGLVALLRMDQGAGTSAYDTSGNGNNGTLTNGPTWTTGKFGGAVSFDGTNDYVETPSVSVSGLTALTYSFWMKTSNGNNLQIVNWADVRFCKIGGLTTGKVNCAAGGTSTASAETATTVNDNNWHNIIFTSTASAQIVYLDGVQSGTSSQTLDTTSGVIRLGSSLAGGSYFSGSIDDVRIYNRALSASEVATLYNSTGGGKLTGVNTTGLVGYWKMNEGTGTTAANSALGTSSNTGTLTNGPTWTSSGKFGSGITFDGGNDYVLLASSPVNRRTSSFTISAWVKVVTGSGTGSHVIISEDESAGDAVWFHVNKTPGSITARVRDNTATTEVDATTASGVVPSNTWTHVAMVFDRSAKSLKTYVNAVLKGSGAASNLNLATLPTTIGKLFGQFTRGGVSLNQANQWFTGSMDEVRIYDRALTANDVLQLYNATADTQVLSRVNSLRRNAASNLQSGLVGWWPFDGAYLTTTTATDLGSGARNGTLTNGPVPKIGKLGQGLYFDGSNDYVQMSSGFSGSFIATSAWFKLDALNSNGATSLVSQNSLNAWDGLNIYVNGNSGIDLVLYKSDGFGNDFRSMSTANSLIATNTWYNVYVELNASTPTIKIYLNGVDVSTTVTTVGTPPTTLYTTPPFRVGMIRNSPTQYGFNGIIDDVRVYSRSLSATEVLQLYNMGK